MKYPFFPAFPLYQELQPAAAQGKCVLRQRAQLRDPKPGAEQELQHDDIPEYLPVPQRIGIIGTLQKGLYDLLWYDARKLLRGMDADVELVKGILFQFAAKLHLAVKGADACQLALYGARGKILVKVFDVLAEHILICPSSLRKVQKLLQINAVSLDRIRGELLFVLARFKITLIDGGAFERCGLKELTLPDTITFINMGAFSDCAELTKIEIPPSVSGIGEGVFDGCESLTIYGSRGSFAESYAKENEIPFLAVE